MFQGLGVNNCPAASCRTCSAKPRPVPSQGPMGCRVRAGPTGSRRIPRQTQCWRSSVLPKPKLHRPLLRAKTASFQVGSWQVMMKSLDEGSLRLIFLRWHRVAFKADRFLWPLPCTVCLTASWAGEAPETDSPVSSGVRGRRDHFMPDLQTDCYSFPPLACAACARSCLQARLEARRRQQNQAELTTARQLGRLVSTATSTAVIALQVP